MSFFISDIFVILIQAFTEFLPISSSLCLDIYSKFYNTTINVNNLHTFTGIAGLIYFFPLMTKDLSNYDGDFNYNIMNIFHKETTKDSSFYNIFINSLNFLICGICTSFCFLIDFYFVREKVFTPIYSSFEHALFNCLALIFFLFCNMKEKRNTHWSNFMIYGIFVFISYKLGISRLGLLLNGFLLNGHNLLISFQISVFLSSCYNVAYIFINRSFDPFYIIGIFISIMFIKLIEKYIKTFFIISLIGRILIFLFIFYI